jgi:hypothetical protein
MLITVRCPNPACAAICSVADDLVGQQVRCGSCKQPFTCQPEEPVAVEAVATEAPDDGPQTIGRYQVRARLGSGACGTVYRAYDPALDREVAVKLIRPDLLSAPHAAERLGHATAAAARMLHPHIVPLCDAGPHQGSYYIASAFIAGRTLAELILEGGRDPRRAVLVACGPATPRPRRHRPGAARFTGQGPASAGTGGASAVQRLAPRLQAGPGLPPGGKRPSGSKGPTLLPGSR